MNNCLPDSNNFMYIMVVTHALSLNINRRTADAIQSDGGRNLIGRRSKHDDKTQQSEQKKVAEARDLRY